jgi:hypothetical protein
LQIHHETIESTKGESYLNWMETHFNIQRRLYDYQFSLTIPPAAFEQAHQAFLATYNTTAHQGLLNDQFDPEWSKYSNSSIHVWLQSSHASSSACILPRNHQYYTSV